MIEQKYAKIIDEKTHEVQIGVGCTDQYYIEIGMTFMDVKKAYNGRWYVANYCPDEPIPTQEEKEENIRLVREHYLNEYVDPYVSNPLRWSDMSTTEQEKRINYRRYLLDYTNLPNWWEKEPLTMPEWEKL